MIVHGVKMTEDIESRKVLYERDGKFFIRSGNDDFHRGKPLGRSYRSYFTQSGYRKMKEPLPMFRDKEELAEGVRNLSVVDGGKVEYTSRRL